MDPIWIPIWILFLDPYTDPYMDPHVDPIWILYMDPYVDLYIDLIWITYGSYVNPYPYMDSYIELNGDLASSFLQFRAFCVSKRMIWLVCSFNLEPSG